MIWIACGCPLASWVRQKQKGFVAPWEKRAIFWSHWHVFSWCIYNVAEDNLIILASCFNIYSLNPDMTWTLVLKAAGGRTGQHLASTQKPNEAHVNVCAQSLHCWMSRANREAFYLRRCSEAIFAHISRRQSKRIYRFAFFLFFLFLLTLFFMKQIFLKSVVRSNAAWNIKRNNYKISRLYTTRKKRIVYDVFGSMVV